MEHVEVKDLSVIKENKQILAVEQESFERGKIYGIVGPSGAGKSTLLRVLNFLEKPATGRINFWGNDVDLTSLSQVNALSLQREMAFAAQKPVMFQTSVYDNVAMGLRFRRVDKTTIHKRVTTALEQVDLLDSARQQAITLSGGEAQRIALARAIVLQPRLLLLDEPTASLDPTNIAIFERVIKSIREQHKTTIIIVTHNLPQAKRLSDISLFVHKGKIVESNETKSFFSSPQSRELTDFLSGEMIY